MFAGTDWWGPAVDRRRLVKYIISDALRVYRRREESKGRGTRALLSTSQDDYEHERTCASRVPAQEWAVNRDATSLLCHVGSEVDGGHVHVEFAYFAGWARKEGSKPAKLTGLFDEDDGEVGEETCKLGNETQLWEACEACRKTYLVQGSESSPFGVRELAEKPLQWECAIASAVGGSVFWRWWVKAGLL